MSELVEDRITLKIQIESQREKLELLILETAQCKEKTLQYEEEVRTVNKQLRDKVDLQAKYDELQVLVEKNKDE